MSELLYKPVYTNTDEIVNLTVKIAALADALNIKSTMQQSLKLRRANRIKSVHSSLAIENNSLSLEQVTAVINGKKVLAPPQDICEVKNAFEAYNNLLAFNPYDIDDLQAAHLILMQDLVQHPGRFRTGAIGVVKGQEVVHIAPRADMVSGLIADLLKWTQKSKAHPLIKSCVFHYEFEFVHPFADGNGRMGRMWQTLLLYKWKSIFAWLPIETIIMQHQSQYYTALGNSNDKGDCTEFVEFMLRRILETLQKHTDQVSDQESDQVERLLSALGSKTLSANELMQKLNLKHKPTFRKNYINPALEKNLIVMTLPDKPNSSNQKYKKNF
ncbi:MAG: Fic family protein [Oscillospiraceae bacterium]|nr:Fic family protein [Oscillospiraceae bacterium]